VLACLPTRHLLSRSLSHSFTLTPHSRSDTHLLSRNQSHSLQPTFHSLALTRLLSPTHPPTHSPTHHSLTSTHLPFTHSPSTTFTHSPTLHVTATQGTSTLVERTVLVRLGCLTMTGSLWGVLLHVLSLRRLFRRPISLNSLDVGFRGSCQGAVKEGAGEQAHSHTRPNRLNPPNRSSRLRP
jgi:hypothetical protein